MSQTQLLLHATPKEFTLTVCVGGNLKRLAAFSRDAIGLYPMAQAVKGYRDALCIDSVTVVANKDDLDTLEGVGLIDNTMLAYV